MLAAVPADQSLRILLEAVAKGVAETFAAVQSSAEKMAEGVSKASKKADAGLRGLGEGIQAAATWAQAASDAGLKNLGAALEEAGKSAERAFSAMEARGESLASSFDSTMGRVSSALTTVATVAVGAVAAAVGAAAVSLEGFNKKLSEIGTLGVSADQLERYKSALLEISRTTSVSLTDLSAGLYETISAGVTDAAEALELLNVAQMAAVAGNTTTAGTVDLLTTALNTFGAKLTDSAERLEFIRTAADKFNVVVDIGKLKTEDLAKGMGRVAATAASAGVTLDEVGASLALLTAGGILPEQAFNALNQTISKFAAPGDKAKEAAEALGIEIGAAAIRSKGFTAVLQEVIDKSGGSIEVLKALFEDIDAVRGVAVLGTVGMDKFGAALEGLGKSTGATRADFRMMSEDIGSRVARIRNNIVADLSGAFDSARVDIADALGDIASTVAANGDGIGASMKSVVGALSSIVVFLVEHKDTIITILGLIFAKKVVDFFLGGLVSITKGLGGVGDAFKTMGSIASGTLTDTSGKLVSGAGKVSAFAGSVATIGGAFMALIPVAVMAVDAVISEIGRAQRELEKFLVATNKAVADASKKAITETSKRFSGISAEIDALAAKDIEAAGRRADELIAVESETLARRRANVDAFNARLRAEREKLAKEELAESLSRADHGAAETKARIVELEAGLAAERHAMEEEVKIREYLAGFTSGSLGIEKAAHTDLADHKVKESKRTAAEAEAALAGAEKSEKASYARRAAEADKFFGTLRRAFVDSAEEMVKLSDVKIALDAEAKAKLRADFKKIGAALQSDVADGLGEGMQEGAAHLDQAEDAIKRVVQEGTDQGVRDGFEAAEDGAKDWTTTFGGRLATILGKVATFFGDALLNVAQGVGDFFLDMFVTGPWGEFMNLLQLAASTSPTATVNDQGETQADSFADVLEEQFQGWIDKITNFVQNLPTLLRGLVPFIGELVNEFVDAVPQIVDTFVANIGPLVQSIIQSIGSLADTFRDNIEEFVSDIEGAIEAWLPKLVDALIDLVLSSLNADVFQRVQQMIADVIGQLIGGIIELLPDLISFILETAPDLIIALVDMILGDLVPKLIETIPDIISAFAEGLPGFISELVGGLVGAILNALPAIVTGLIDTFISTGGGFLMAYEIIKGLVLGIVEVVKVFIDKLKEFFSGLNIFGRQEQGGRNRQRAVLGVATGGISELFRAAGRVAHSGGVVMPSGVQRFDMGGVVDAIRDAAGGRPDEVPILATPGEVVLNRGQQAALAGALAGGGNTYVFQPGSAVLVDAQRAVDSAVSKLLDEGGGRTGAVTRRQAGAPYRKARRFGLGGG